jgi:hypothetical protein
LLSLVLNPGEIVIFSFARASKAIAGSVFTSFACVGIAHAGLITVVIDNFNSPSLASPGVVSTTLLGNPDARNPAFTVGTSGGKFAIDLSTNVSAEVSLSYGSVPLPTGFTSADVSYVVTFSNLGNHSLAANGVGGPNTITVSSAAANSYFALPNAANPDGVVGSSAFGGGNLTLLFKTPSTRSWDLSIDSLELRINCAGVADATYDVKSTPAGPVSGLVAYIASGPTSCAKVPVPASSALVVLGLLGLALRRKV